MKRLLFVPVAVQVACSGPASTAGGMVDLFDATELAAARSCDEASAAWPGLAFIGKSCASGPLAIQCVGSLVRAGDLRDLERTRAAKRGARVRSWRLDAVDTAPFGSSESVTWAQNQRNRSTFRRSSESGSNGT